LFRKKKNVPSLETVYSEASASINPLRKWVSELIEHDHNATYIGTHPRKKFIFFAYFVKKFRLKTKHKKQLL